MAITIDNTCGKLIPNKIISPPKITLAIWITDTAKKTYAVAVSVLFLFINPSLQLNRITSNVAPDVWGL